MMLGTPTYMSPEQCRGSSQLDGQSDVYSLGVVFYHMLTGAAPFRAESDLVLLNLHAVVDAPSVQEAASEVSDATAALLARMLAKDKTARPTMAEVAQATGATAPQDSAPASRTVVMPVDAHTAVLATQVKPPAATVPQRTVRLAPRGSGPPRWWVMMAMMALVLVGIALGLSGARRATQQTAGAPSAPPPAKRSDPGSAARQPTAPPQPAIADAHKDSGTPLRPKSEPGSPPKATRRKPGDRSQGTPNARINPHDIID
jgi:hypothetical protein